MPWPLYNHWGLVVVCLKCPFIYLLFCLFFTNENYSMRLLLFDLLFNWCPTLGELKSRTKLNSSTTPNSRHFLYFFFFCPQLKQPTEEMYLYLCCCTEGNSWLSVVSDNVDTWCVKFYGIYICQCVFNGFSKTVKGSAIKQGPFILIHWDPRGVLLSHQSPCHRTGNLRKNMIKKNANLAVLNSKWLHLFTEKKTSTVVS